MCRIPGCENETEYDIDYWCEEHWKKFDNMVNENED